MSYASEFSEIIECLKNNESLKVKILELIESEPIPGKVIEGEGRLEALRIILADFFNGKWTVEESIQEVEFRLPRNYSPHENNNRVFPQGWAERLLRTNISCFYNQAVLMRIIESGSSECYVDHSSAESADSNCSKNLAGRTHDASMLLDRLLKAYREGHWNKDVKIPDHPHCTHTVQPV
ncbi:hypothetical protein [Shewanella atlantica]|uniref:Uncharacterized protein n=1 Tax=Shewanella atlantica TaxID=271099 RepID=A0A431W5C7_9GAMM|nr:hypothetical protein [Shewanella atlantica]RTR30662.1 hypothetical protein EKG39_15715 [Shewanella atlantica]